MDPKTGLPLDSEEAMREAVQPTEEAAPEVVVEQAEQVDAVPVVIAVEPQVNGVVPEAPPVVAVVVDTNGINGTDHAHPAPAPVPGTHTPVSPAPPPPPAPAPAPIKFYDMDLEKMHYKLYYIGYLTPQEFLEDLTKIVKNAEHGTSEDSDRLFKAQQMVVTAKLLLNGWEPQFKAECERMAGRESQRRLERKKARAAEKAAAKAKEEEAKNAEGKSGSDEPPAHSYGTRRATRHNGIQPEVVDDPVDIERRLKRQRSEATGASAEPEASGSGVDTEMADPDRAAKRARTTPMPDGSPVDAAQTSRLSAEAVAEPAQQSSPLPTTEPVEGADPNVMAVDPLAQAVVPPIADPEPQEPFPVFHIDESRLQALGDHLVHSTSALKVEQLEQLRAICLNCIWTHRGDWDRDAMIGRMMEVVTDFVQQVQQVDIAA